MSDRRQPCNMYERAFEVLPCYDLPKIVQQFFEDLPCIQAEVDATVEDPNDRDELHHHPLCILYANRIAELAALGGGRHRNVHEGSWHVCRHRVGRDYEFPAEPTFGDLFRQDDEP